MKGYIMQLQPFSVNDGDGIRTTIFIAGCPLRCRWCSNPEGFASRELVGWYQRKCIGCGACTAACPQKIGIDLNASRDLCTACGSCVSACPEGARTYMVRLTDTDEILARIQKHRLFYMYSGGGITFSGGEATSQPDLLDFLTREIYDMGFSMDIESCGHFDFDRLRPSLERMDLIFMDLKLMDTQKHRLYTGASNQIILENIARLAELPAKAVIRIPVIGGVNDDDDNIRRSAAYVHEHLPEASIELLPYHQFGKIKYEALGMVCDDSIGGPGGSGTSGDRDGASNIETQSFTTPSAARLDHLKRLIAAEGVSLADYR